VTAPRVRLAAADEIPPGEGRVVEAAGRVLAVFNVEGRFYAIDNACMHRGGPLGEGELTGTVVTCPWHAWRWDVTTGANVNNPAVRMAAVPVTVENGQLYAELEPAG
jgi:nitrite reductase/ring-hydroxylating ferredoxin subunit